MVFIKEGIGIQWNFLEIQTAKIANPPILKEMEIKNMKSMDK